MFLYFGHSNIIHQNICGLVKLWQICTLITYLRDVTKIKKYFYFPISHASKGSCEATLRKPGKGKLIVSSVALHIWPYTDQFPLSPDEKQELNKNASSFDKLLMEIPSQDIVIEETGGSTEAKRKSPVPDGAAVKRRASVISRLDIVEAD